MKDNMKEFDLKCIISEFTSATEQKTYDIECQKSIEKRLIL
jgi:hypothetical protein